MQYFKGTLKREAQITCFAQVSWPVLIVGETGVGKEKVAEQLHGRSPRSRAPFVPINCGGLPGPLFESELFGHEKGAFSGAVQHTRGLLRQAHGGTLFLDEVGELDLSLQVKLLRTLESKEIRSVGSTRIENIDVRFMAATNVDLRRAVAEGKFRADLYERLSVLRIEVPPLRRRPNDILALAKQILKELETSFDPHALSPLQHYNWPGNVRQLRNLLIRASVLGSKHLSPALISECLHEEKSQRARPEPIHAIEGTLADIERAAIVRKLTQCRGNRKRAAKELGIAKSTLHEKLRKWKESAEAPLGWPLVRVPAPMEPTPPSAHRAHPLDL